MSKFHPNVRPKDNSIRIYSFTLITSLSSSPNLFTNNTPFKSVAGKQKYPLERIAIHGLCCA